MINFIKRLGAAVSFAAALFVIIACMAMTSSSAEAGIFVCNDAGTQISVAIGWKEGEAWSSRGWYNIRPRDCAYAVSGALQNSNFYYYAHSSDNSMKWSDGADSAHFCTSKDKFYYSYTNDPPCEGYNFRKANTGGQDLYTLRLGEGVKDPAEAARACMNTMSNGRDAFVKCWTRNVATNTQRKILDCWDKTGTYSSFAVCSSQGYLNQDTAAAIDCVAKNANDPWSAKTAMCLANGRLSEQDARILNCAVSAQGSLVSMGSCAVTSQLTPEQRRLVDCVATNRGSYTSMAFCAAGSYATPEQRRIADCVVRNRTSYVGMGVCAASNSLTSEQQAFVQCAMTSGGQPYVFAGCVGTQLTLNELEKCFTQGIGGSGCFGNNNEAVKFVRNAWKDVTQGPGPSNDLVGRDGALVRTARNVIAGPVGDVARGEIGGSDQSVWRKDLHLPRIRLW